MAMLYNIAMPRGDSGRIVLEVDPIVKSELYDALDEDGFTLKDWFLRQAKRYQEDRVQPSLFSVASETVSPYNQGNSKEKITSD